MSTIRNYLEALWSYRNILPLCTVYILCFWCIFYCFFVKKRINIIYHIFRFQNFKYSPSQTETRLYTQQNKQSYNCKCGWYFTESSFWDYYFCVFIMTRPVFFKENTRHIYSIVVLCITVDEETMFLLILLWCISIFLNFVFQCSYGIFIMNKVYIINKNIYLVTVKPINLDYYSWCCTMHIFYIYKFPTGTC